MAILIKKAQKIAGIDCPNGVLVLGLEKDVEAQVQQGGGADPVSLGSLPVVSPSALAHQPDSLVAGVAKVAMGQWALGRPARVQWGGNSLVDTFGGYAEALGYWSATSHIINTLMMCGGAIDMRNRLSVGNDANTWDRWGNVGHGGATMPTITSDLLNGGLLAQMATDGVPPPDIYVAAALPANDIGTEGVDAATAIKRFNLHLQTVAAVWPGVRFLLLTPWASAYYDTGAKRATADALRTHVKSLELASANVASVDVSRLYAGDDWQPYAGLTDGIHPVNTDITVSQRVGRAVAKRLLGLLGGRASWGKALRSPNPGMTGTVAAGALGTAPTGCSFTSAAPAGGTIASVAEQPGWTITFGNVDGVIGKDFGDFSLANIVPSDLTKIDPVVAMTIESGAENFLAIQIRCRMFYDDASNDFKLIVMPQGTFQKSEWLNGDPIDCVLPRIVPTAGKTLTSIAIYCKAYMKGQVGSTTIRVKTLGAL